MKYCHSCKQTKMREYFRVSKDFADGLALHCQACEIKNAKVK
jgi:hypothetical protein